MKKLSIKCISLILIMTIIFSFIQAFFIKSEVNAALSSSYTQYIKSGIDAFPESYRPKLRKLKELYPNWEFKAYYTGIEWNELTSSSAENACRKNTIHKGNLLDPLALCKCGRMGDSNYYCASAKAVNFYLDPRNFMGEAMIFQFLDLSNGEGVNREVVEKAVAGTCLSGYVDDIMAAAKEAEINPLHIVATIFQEIGRGTDNVPKAISGTVKGYEGLYNFYNYGATDGAGAVERGLEKARELGWTTPRFALIDGAKRVLANGYISVGQTTKYFYKFDVVGNEILTESAGKKTYPVKNFYSHQYMTNLRDPASQAGMLYDIYADSQILNEKLTFVIPVYGNMPASVPVPTTLTNSDGQLYYINSLKKGGIAFRKTAGGTSLGNIYKDTVVVLLENQGKWSKVKLNVATTYDAQKRAWNYEEKVGFVATEYLAKLDDNTVPDGDVGNEEKYKIDGEYVYTVPKSNVKDIKDKNADAVIKKADGTIVNAPNDLLGTGYTITTGGKTYTCIKLGDANGDGYVDTGDTFLEKQVVMEVKNLTGVFKNAADVNKDGYVDTGDTFKLKKCVLGIEEINL